MSAARDTVLGKPELLELLLIHLPMRDLLVTSPLVSKTWQVLTLTPAIQRALFFEPDPFSGPRKNPLLVELFPPFFVPEGPSPSGLSWPGTTASIKSMPWSKAPDAFKREETSWQRMLVTQPPAQSIMIKDIRIGWCSTTRCAVLNNLSLRMSLMYDLVAWSIDSCEETAFYIRWSTPHSENDLQCDLTLGIKIFEEDDRALWRFLRSGTKDEWLQMKRARRIDKRFYSEAWKKVEIDFGEAVFSRE
ncbi:putative f-box domain protein [Mycena venus]|uniref:Putative f-box domain protein n=1 Tax=Mycena venus TaxID=2733690 RepID=A0A8H6YK79_9AGAR|nr:putative f-box domain protein [Mycena venus]